MRALVLIAGLLLATAARAGALETAPTTVELSPTNRSGVLYLANRSDHPITFQVEAFDWVQEGGGEELVQSATLQVSPPMAELAPGQKQTVRVRATGPAARGEQAFRLLVSELPGPGAEPGQVRVLLQFSVPVFAGSDREAKPAVAWRAWREGPDVVLVAANSGGRRAKLSSLTVGAAGTQVPVPGGQLAYVLAGASRTWRVPAAGLPPGAPLIVQAGAGETASRFDVPVTAGGRD